MLKFQITTLSGSVHFYKADSKFGAVTQAIEEGLSPAYCTLY